MEEQILSLCGGLEGLAQDSLLRKMHKEKEEDIVACLNSLLEQGLLEVIKKDRTLFYKASDLSSCTIDLNEDEKIIFNCIKSTGNSGIWTKDIKTKTNLHQAVIAKVLKGLEGKKVIKAVKSAKNSTRRLYMLYELEPSQEIAGGPWFTDFELDCEFVEELVGSTFKLLKPKISPDDQTSIFPLNHPYPTLESLGVLIRESRICNTDLQAENVQQILTRLFYDGCIHITDTKETSTMYQTNEHVNMYGIDVGSSTY